MEESLIPIIIGAVCIFGLFAVLSLAVILPTLGIFGGVGLWMKNRSDKAKGIRESAQDWARTRGVILKSRVQVSGGEHTSVSPYIEYRYQVGAIEYTSVQIRPGDQVWQVYGGNEPYDLVDKYPVGAEVDVYYNPDDPSAAALER